MLNECCMSCHSVLHSDTNFLSSIFIIIYFLYTQFVSFEEVIENSFQ